MATFQRRVGLAALVAGIGCLGAAGAASAATPKVLGDTPGIRTVDSQVQALLDRGRARSEAFRALVTGVEQSGWTVFVVRGRCPSREILACLPHDVAYVAGHVLARVILDDRHRSSPEDQLGYIAHELQHVLEAASGGVVDRASMRAEFRRIGYVSVDAGRARAFETEAAVKAGLRVRDEMYRNARASAHDPHDRR